MFLKPSVLLQSMLQRICKHLSKDQLRKGNEYEILPLLLHRAGGNAHSSTSSGYLQKFPTSPQFGEAVEILAKLPKQYQILFQSGFNCSILLQRVRFGGVVHVPTPQAGQTVPP